MSFDIEKMNKVRQAMTEKKKMHAQRLLQMHKNSSEQLYCCFKPNIT